MEKRRNRFHVVGSFESSTSKHLKECTVVCAYVEIQDFVVDLVDKYGKLCSIRLWSLNLRTLC